MIGIVCHTPLPTGWSSGAIVSTERFVDMRTRTTVSTLSFSPYSSLLYVCDFEFEFGFDSLAHSSARRLRSPAKCRPMTPTTNRLESDKEKKQQHNQRDGTSEGERGQSIMLQRIGVESSQQPFISQAELAGGRRSNESRPGDHWQASHHTVVFARICSSSILFPQSLSSSPASLLSLSMSAPSSKKAAAAPAGKMAKTNAPTKVDRAEGREGAK